MMNIDLISMVRLTGHDFLDVLILQLAAIGIAMAYAEYLTRRASR
jgi:hypothetical protein